ncbi:MAG: GNAT family N-acetyltransferase [Armatimonadota bacterium]
MARTDPVEILDRYYASQLGCTPEQLDSGEVIIVPNENTAAIRFAKGSSLLLYAMSKGRGAIITVRPEIAEELLKCIRDAQPGQTLTDELCNSIENCLRPKLGTHYWFRGYRLYCEPKSFKDCSFGEVRDISDEDETGRRMHDTWRGPVFGQIVEGKPVTWCAVKVLSDIVWDISIETLPGYRRQGYAKSTVSAAVKYCFSCGCLVGWGCNRDNIASLKTALAVGFKHYALDFGCEEEK